MCVFLRPYSSGLQIMKHFHAQLKNQKKSVATIFWQFNNDQQKKSILLNKFWHFNILAG